MHIWITYVFGTPLVKRQIVERHIVNFERTYCQLLLDTNIFDLERKNLYQYLDFNSNISFLNFNSNISLVYTPYPKKKKRIQSKKRKKEVLVKVNVLRNSRCT